jgi:hypothetical protein
LCPGSAWLWALPLVRCVAKWSKLHPLTPEQKTANRELSGQRIFCEHIIKTKTSSLPEAEDNTR